MTYFFNSIVLVIAVTLIAHVVLQLTLQWSGSTNPVFIDAVNRFNVDAELSVPTWLSSILALVAATLALIVGRAQKKSGSYITWILLASLLLYISIDEVSSLHELILQGLHISANFGESQTFTHNALLLVLPFIAVGAVGTAALLYKNLPRKTFLQLLAAFVVYALGALVIEYVSIETVRDTIAYKAALTTFEEMLELVGLALIIRAIINHICTYEQKISKLLSGL